MKPSLKIISVAFLAAAVCGALVQRSALSNVHQENEKLRGESEEVRRLAEGYFRTHLVEPATFGQEAVG